MKKPKNPVPTDGNGKGWLNPWLCSNISSAFPFIGSVMMSGIQWFRAMTRAATCIGFPLFNFFKYRSWTMRTRRKVGVELDHPSIFVTLRFIPVRRSNFTSLNCIIAHHHKLKGSLNVTHFMHIDTADIWCMKQPHMIWLHPSCKMWGSLGERNMRGCGIEQGTLHNRQKETISSHKTSDSTQR